MNWLLNKQTHYLIKASMSKVVLASSNPGKVAEMQIELERFGLQIVPQSDYDFPDAIEDGLSFV